MRLLAGARTTDGQVMTGKGVLGGALLCAGSDAATAAYYDGTNTSGRLLAKLACAAATSTSWNAPGADSGAGGVPFETGLYVDLSGTSPAAVAYYAGQ